MCIIYLVLNVLTTIAIVPTIPVYFIHVREILLFLFTQHSPQFEAFFWIFIVRLLYNFQITRTVYIKESKRQTGSP